MILIANTAAESIILPSRVDTRPPTGFAVSINKSVVLTVRTIGYLSRACSERGNKISFGPPGKRGQNYNKTLLFHNLYIICKSEFPEYSNYCTPFALRSRSQKSRDNRISLAFGVPISIVISFYFSRFGYIRPVFD